MKSKLKTYLPRLSIALLIIIISASTLFSCTGTRVYTKEEINQNISAIDSEDTRYNYVYLYLQSVGMPVFDTTKFYWAEAVFGKWFNLEGGLPQTAEHARMTAEAFMSDYYDVIDRTDKAAVTDALITCYTEAVADPYSIYRIPEDSECQFK